VWIRTVLPALQKYVLSLRCLLHAECFLPHPAHLDLKMEAACTREMPATLAAPAEDKSNEMTPGGTAVLLPRQVPINGRRYKLFKISDSLGFCTLSVIQNCEYKKAQRFGNWVSFRPQDPVIEAHTSSFRSISLFLHVEFWMMDRPRDRVSLNGLHHRQNPLDCTFQNLVRIVGIFKMPFSLHHN
jgi:hypothetical protein